MIIKVYSNDLKSELMAIGQWHDFSNKNPKDPIFDLSKLGQTGYMKDENGSGQAYEFMVRGLYFVEFHGKGSIFFYRKKTCSYFYFAGRSY